MPSHYMHLEIEELEPRVALDADTFTGGPGGLGTAWSNVANWYDTTTGKPATMLPGAHDDVTIPTGLAGTVVLDTNGDTTINSLSVAGGLLVGSTAPSSDVTPNVSTSVGDTGTITVGAASGAGTASLNAASATLGTSSGGTGTLNIGDPGSGNSGDASITNLTDNAFATLNVGGSGLTGSTGTLDVGTLSTIGSPSTPNLVVNIDGTASVTNSATIGGKATVAGHLQGETGSTITLSGPGTVTSSGVLSTDTLIDFASSSAWVIDPNGSDQGNLGSGTFDIHGGVTVATGQLVPQDVVNLDAGGSFTGAGSLDLLHDFNWYGGTLGVTGGTTIEPSADFKTEGSGAKTLSADLTNIGGVVDLGGTRTLDIVSGGDLINQASATNPMDVSLTTISGAGKFDNDGAMSMDGTSGLTISSLLDNEGSIDLEAAAGTLVLSNYPGPNVLNGSINLNGNSMTISGGYTTSTSFEEDFSAGDLTTLTGTLTIDSGASADFDHLVLGTTTTAGTVTGAGELSIDAKGLNSGDYLDWTNGTISGTGTTTIGVGGTLNLTGTVMLSDNTLENKGTVNWVDGARVSITGTKVSNEKNAVFDFQALEGGGIPTFTNDGMLEIAAGHSPLVVGTFTQSSTGTLQSDIASASNYGVLSVTGTATVDRTLQAQLENGYQPPSGTDFKVLTFGSLSGQFATIVPSTWSARYDSSDVTLVSA